MNQQTSKPEASTLSVSQLTGIDAAAKKNIINGRSSFVDSIFPLFDEMLKRTKLPQFLYIILMMFVVFQIICVSFWISIPGYLDFVSLPGKILNKILLVVFFSKLDLSFEELLIPFIFFVIFIVIYISALLVQLLYYSKHRRFNKWSLYVNRLVIELIPPLFMIPTGNFVGKTFYLSFTKDYKFLIYFILGIFCFVGYAFGLFLMAYLFAGSSYVSLAPIACWDGFVHFILYIAIASIPIISFTVRFFSGWVRYALFILKIAFNVYMITETFYHPFVQSMSNMLVASIFAAVTPLDIACLIQYTGVVKIPIWVKFVIFVISFIASILVFKNVFRKIMRTIAHNMKDKALEAVEVDPDMPDVEVANKSMLLAFLTDKKKRQLFANLKLDKRKKKSHLYLRTGLALGSNRFTDWSVIKYIAEYHQDSHTICTICQFISFFPSETRLLNYFFFQACRQQKLSLSSRFMLYELHKIKTLRQSSASSEVTEKLMTMKATSMRGIQSVRSFWETVPRDINVLYNIRSSTSSTSYLFEEAIQMWPNNSRLCEEYANFLCECATNFTSSIKYKNRSELIEQGKNFIIDLSFRSLVQAYPHYLKRKIVDIKGHFIEGKAREKGSSSQLSSNNGSTVNTSLMLGELDQESEERLAKSYFSHHRLRLAFQKCLDNRKSNNSEYLKFSAFFALAALIVIIIALYIWLFDVFQPREQNMDRQRFLNNMRYGYDASFITIVIYFLNKKGVISDSLLGSASGGLSMKSPKTNNFNIQLSTEMHPYNTTTGLSHRDFALMDEAQRWIIFSRNNLDKFLSSVVSFAASGGNVYKIMSSMVSEIVPFDFCSENLYTAELIGNPTNKSLKTELVYILQKIGNLTQARYSNASDWHKNKGVCETIYNTAAMFDAFDRLTSSLTQTQVTENHKVRNQLLMAFGIICGIFILVILPPIIFFLHKAINELYYLLDAMRNFDKSVKEEASQPFRSTNNNDQDVMSDTNSSGGVSMCFLYMNIFVFGLVSLSMLAVIIFVTVDMNNSFLDLNKWLLYGISRLNYMIEISAYNLLGITLTLSPKTMPFIKAAEAIALGRKTLNSLRDYNNNILRGNADIRPCIGGNARLDQLHFDDDCHGNLNLGGFHDFYRCAGIDRGITLFCVLLEEMLSEPAKVNLSLDQPIYHSFHLMNCHLIDPTYEASTILTQLASTQINKFHTILSAICFGGACVLIILFGIFLSNVLRLDVAYSGSLQLMRRVPPSAVISNQKLLMYLLNKKHHHDNESKMTVSKKILFNSKDPILCLAKNGSIEIVTKSVTMIFGYTPEQLLGQQLSMVLPEDKNTKVFEQLALMLKGEANLNFDTSGECINDNDLPVPVHVTILGTAEPNTKCANSFVIVLRDETDLTEQRQQAEEAKKKSEDLLYQILPRDIVNRINQGEKDISFVVPNASVIFCDIVKFSDYAANLTPAQIMENLSMIFAAFDNSAAKYGLITKIKLIGDVYMAAANLFAQEENPQSHATQTIQFALDVLSDLDEINGALDSNLSIRIGINTDGPLIAGVLGTDKPVFDIIGDTINVAARLQSNAIHNTIQISQTTFDAVVGMNFNIEQRGLIELKGKGKRMAYIVRPGEAASSFMIGDPSNAT